MANEITVGERTARNAMTLLFTFPIAAPKQVAGENVVVSPSAGLPTNVAGVISQAEKDAMDAGTLAFETISFQYDPEMSGPELLARARQIYASRLQAFSARYTARFQHTGSRFNAEE